MNSIVTDERALKEQSEKEFQEGKGPISSKNGLRVSNHLINDHKLHALPEISWSRKLSHQFPPIKDFSVGFKEGLKLASLGFRMWKYVRRETAAGRVPVMDPFNPPIIEPLMGVPIGGIGGGSIGRGWRGDFMRWQVAPCGIAQTSAVDADQFSVYIRHKPTEFPKPQSTPTNSPRTAAKTSKTFNSNTVTSVLHPGKLSTKGSKVNSQWGFELTGNWSTYHALFPRAWTAYEEPDPNIRIVCRQISPVIPHNYKESSFPVGVFVWTIENVGKTEAEVSLMFSFQNGMGGKSDTSGGHVNSTWNRNLTNDGKKKAVGVTLKHSLKQDTVIDGITNTFEDPLSFSIGVMEDLDEENRIQISCCPRFTSNSNKSLDKLWKDFKADGVLREIEGCDPSKKGESIAAALAAKVLVKPGTTREVVFSLGWDCPIARFSSGAAYFRRYTKFYGNKGNAVENIVFDALSNYQSWEEQIEAWQNPILNDTQLPDYYKAALFNELYYIVDGGTIWTTGSKTNLEAELEHGPHEKGTDSYIPEPDHIGHFGYLESLEYLMYNTYDVHFYASFALAMLWPKLELSLQRDIAIATLQQYPEKWEIMGSGELAMRKVRGAVPHDMGNPGEDPWNKVNSYCIQDISRWKDLPCKFVLQIYRDYIITGDKSFLSDLWPVIKETIKYAIQFDTDGDGVLDNENFPDQTYDTWSAVGCSAYSGGLWLACLSAAIAMSEIMEDTEPAKEYSEILIRGKKSYNEKLWNGQYYNYDCSDSAHHDSIMADQLAGHWYAKACGLKSIVPESNAYLSLRTVYTHNVKGFKEGTMGAINGMRPNGQLDDTCMQSLEVWTGTTYAAAAAMLQQGLVKEAFATMKGIISSTYQEYGYMFQTPEAWDTNGRYRSASYMRPLAIWSIQWAWEKFYNSEKEPSATIETIASSLANGSKKELDDSLKYLTKEKGEATTEPLGERVEEEIAKEVGKETNFSQNPPKDSEIEVVQME